jgi:hypothetical protein
MATCSGVAEVNGAMEYWLRMGGNNNLISV